MLTLIKGISIASANDAAVAIGVLQGRIKVLEAEKEKPDLDCALRE